MTKLQSSKTQTAECDNDKTQTTECDNDETQTAECQSDETVERRCLQSVGLQQSIEHQSSDPQTLSGQTQAEEIEIGNIKKTKELKRRDKNFIFKFFQPTVLLNKLNLWCPEQLLSLCQQPTVIREQPVVLCDKCGSKLSTACSKPEQTRKIRNKFSDETLELDDWCDIRVNKPSVSGGLKY